MNEQQSLIDESTVVEGLVLTGGGARGAYQAGVLAALGERIEAPFPFSVITGVSAGGINASAIASHSGTFRQAADQLVDAWLRLTVDQVFKASSGALVASALRWAWMVATGGHFPDLEVRGILDTQPLYKYLSGVMDLEGIDGNIKRGRLRALALSATSYSTGNTVSFVQGVDGSTDWKRARRRSVHTEIGLDHVMASAALPLVFPAIRLGDDYYGDGSIRQDSPLAPAVHLGAERLLTISVRYSRTDTEDSERQITGYPPPAHVLGMLMHGVFLDSLENDAERLQRINQMLTLMPAKHRSRTTMRPVKLLVLRPSRDLGKLSAGMTRHLPRALRIITKGLGASRTTTPDFLSYVLFEHPYIDRLIELGYEDGRRESDRVLAFLNPDA